MSSTISEHSVRRIVLVNMEVRVSNKNSEGVVCYEIRTRKDVVGFRVYLVVFEYSVGDQRPCKESRFPHAQLPCRATE